MKNKLKKGFTVLEFLIVIAIIMILLAIILPNLQTARERSYDEKRVTDLKTISLGLEQFKQACGSYPNSIVASYPCDTDINSTLVNFIPEIPQYNFNDPTSLGYIYYAPLSISPSDSECVAFHIGVKLKNETTGIFAVEDANVNSGSTIYGTIYYPCSSGSGLIFNGDDDGDGLNIYDIFKR